VMTEQVKLRTQAIKKHDREHPVLFHGLCDDLWDFVTSSADFWKMKEHVDLLGDTSGPGGPYVADMLRCSGRDKVKWSCEIHAISGKTFQPPRPQTFDSIKYHILIPLMRDSRGFLFWQYRPELHGWETPAWGLVKLDGSPAPQFEYAKRICALLQENASFIKEMKFMPKSDIAILFVPEEKIFAWCGAYTEETHHEAVEGIYLALYDGNFNCDFLHPKDVEAGLLSNYKVLFCPEPYWLPAPLLAQIKEWVKAGGTLISEAYFAGMNVETGLHNTIVPGAGFEEVFGVVQDDAVPLDLEENERAHFLLTPKGRAVLPGATEFYGMILYERYRLYDTATPIAQTEDGKTVAALAPFGSGKALAVGTYFGIHHSRNRDTQTGDFIRALARFGGARPHARVENNICVRVDLAGNGERTWVLLTNNEGRPVEADVCMDEGIAAGKEICNLFTGETVPLNEGKFRIRLEKDAVELFELVR